MERLSEQDIAWVEETIANMTDEEKVGQLFFQLTSNADEDALKELVEKYHIGGYRFNGIKSLHLLKSGSGGPAAKTPAEELCDRLIAKGFDAFVYESPLDKIKKDIAEGKPPKSTEVDLK